MRRLATRARLGDRRLDGGGLRGRQLLLLQREFLLRLQIAPLLLLLQVPATTRWRLATRSTSILSTSCDVISASSDRHEAMRRLGVALLQRAADALSASYSASSEPQLSSIASPICSIERATAKSA